MNLIELEQSESAPRYSHSSHHVTQGLDDRRNTGRGLVAPSLLGWISFYRRLCSWNGAARRKVAVRTIVLGRAPFRFFDSNMIGR
jgi:fatty acid desaturase